MNLVVKPYEKFDNMAKERINSYLSRKGIPANYRVYRAQRNYGDLTFDFQRSGFVPERDEIISLSDDLLAFNPAGKFVNAVYRDGPFSSEVLTSAMDGDLFLFQKKDEKVLVEHTSANPTGPLHIGRVRNSIIGDTIARLLKKFGFDVKTEYYVNDIGTQVEALLLATELFKDLNYTEAYQKIFQNFDQYKDEVEKMMLRAESGDEEFIRKSTEKLKMYLSDVLSDLSRLSIEFDMFIWESRFILDGSVRDVLSKLGPVLKDENGAKYIDFGEGKIYLTRSNGTSVYFTRDVAHHIMKNNQFQRSIDVLGEDHREHFRKLKYVLDFFGIKGVEGVFYSFITTKQGRMSTRRGNVVYVRDFIDEAVERAREEIISRRRDLSEDELDDISKKIGAAAVRYNIIKYSLEKPVTFDWSEALNFEGDAAPFVMYSYARARSILSKVDVQGDINFSFTKEEAPLLRMIALYPEVVEDAVTHIKPERIPRYAFDLASSFNQFYRDCDVLGSGDNKGRRVEIVKAFSRTMEEVFDILGIKPSDKI